MEYQEDHNILPARSYHSVQVNHDTVVVERGGFVQVQWTLGSASNDYFLVEIQIDNDGTVHLHKTTNVAEFLEFPE